MHQTWSVTLILPVPGMKVLRTKDLPVSISCSRFCLIILLSTRVKKFSSVVPQLYLQQSSPLPRPSVSTVNSSFLYFSGRRDSHPSLCIDRFSKYLLFRDSTLFFPTTSTLWPFSVHTDPHLLYCSPVFRELSGPTYREYPLPLLTLKINSGLFFGNFLKFVSLSY